MALLSGFSMQQQAQDNWCWAAVSVSVFLFFQDQRWTEQCDLVNDTFRVVLGGQDCCSDGTTTACDRPWDIGEVLALKGHLADSAAGSADYDTINNQIANLQAPVVIRVQLDGGLADHFMAIVGCDVDAQGNQIIYVADPSRAAGNSSHYELANFPENYRSGCTWENTYQTQAGS